MNTDTPADAKKAKPAKLQIPPSTFDTELTAGTVKTAMKDASAVAATGELWQVPIGQLRRIPDFNVRIETPSYKEHRNGLRQSIIQNGFYKNKPLAGFVAKEGDAQIIYVTDGYTRLGAVEDAIEFDGLKIETLPVIVHPAGTTMEDLTVGLVQANSGRQLTAYEKALVAKRLKGLGWEDAKIAESLSFTPRYVADLLTLAGAPAKVRLAVINEKISPAEAVKAIKKHGDKAGAVIDAAAKKAEAKGKTKAKPADVKEAGDEAEGGESGEGSTKSKFSAAISTKKGKVTTTLTYDLKLGDILDADKLKPISRFLDGVYWNFVDDSKAHVVIEEATKIVVTIVQPEKADDDTFADAPAGKDSADVTGGDDDDTFDDGDQKQLGGPAEGEANLPDDGDAAVSDDEL